jgi:hypothetical protein
LGPVTVFKWDPDGKPDDYYELITDMTHHLGEDFLLVTEQEDIAAIKTHFVSSKLTRELEIPIYSNSYRKYYVYLLTGFKGPSSHSSAAGQDRGEACFFEAMGFNSP